MKYILNIGFGIVGLITMISCQTKWNYLDTGLVNRRFDGNMYAYFHSNRYDWDSTLILIEKAGLADLFKGNDPEYKEITFLGPTNHSIRRWMINNRIASLRTLEDERCRAIILRHVIKGKHMRDDIPEGEQKNLQEMGEGGKIYTTEGEARLWIFTFKDEYNGVAGTGSKNIYLYSLDKKVNMEIASSNIEPDNGVVHSLSYAYTLEEL